MGQSFAANIDSDRRQLDQNDYASHEHPFHLASSTGSQSLDHHISVAVRLAEGMISM
jgi:hypothetical protein